jgi:hypothetical protein
MALIQISLTLHFLLTNPVRFIPMKLSKPNPTTPQAHSGNAFHLPPPAPAIPSSQSGNITNTATGGDSLNIRDFADDLEIWHWRILVSCSG